MAWIVEAYCTGCGEEPEVLMFEEFDSKRQAQEAAEKVFSNSKVEYEIKRVKKGRYQ